MGTGPTVSAGYDLALTELAGPRYLAEAGSPRGTELLEELGGDEPGEADLRGGRRSSAAAPSSAWAEALDTDDIRDLLRANLEHPRWDEVAERCLTCGNCTLVCPTCFCTSVEDANDLAGGADRSRVWDSCFSVDYSYIHGGAIRQSPRARYRQWLTHKLGTWHDQFGSSGCVGCGRCITWCPVGIDITEEVAAIRATGEERRMKTLDAVVAESPVFAGLDQPYLELVAGCASNIVFSAGDYLFREGDPADTFYLVRHGRVMLETFVPGRGAVTIETIDDGEVIGWSWLFPPHRWHFDARALDLVRGVVLRRRVPARQARAPTGSSATSSSTASRR